MLNPNLGDPADHALPAAAELHHARFRPRAGHGPDRQERRQGPGAPARGRGLRPDPPRGRAGARRARRGAPRAAGPGPRRARSREPRRPRRDAPHDRHRARRRSSCPPAIPSSAAGSSDGKLDPEVDPARLPDPRDRVARAPAGLPRLGVDQPEAARRSSMPLDALLPRVHRERPPRDLRDRRAGDRDVRGGARLRGPVHQRAGRRTRSSSPATRPRRSTSSPTRGAARTSAAATRSCSPRWSTTRTSCPWQILAQEKDGDLEFIPITDDGVLRQDVFEVLLRLKPKLVAFTHVSNTLGHDQPGRRDGRRGPRGGRARAHRRRPGRAARPGRRPGDRRRLLRVLAATRCSARPAPARCGRGGSCSSRCRRSWPAAT